jgi:prepilin signal peptidase PulO-like enzyme (type II secretory pathway)
MRYAEVTISITPNRRTPMSAFLAQLGNILSDPTPDYPFRVFAGLLFGLVLGSFVTMASYRLPRRLSIVTPPSSCPVCTHRLGVPDLVPVFSWLFLRGRCRHCHTKIPARYPLIELATALLVTAVVSLLGFSLWTPPALLFATAFMIKLTTQIER